MFPLEHCAKTAQPIYFLRQKGGRLAGLSSKVDRTDVAGEAGSGPRHAAGNGGSVSPVEKPHLRDRTRLKQMQCQYIDRVLRETEPFAE